MTQILFKKNHPDAVMPTKGTEHAAAFDLVAVSVEDKGDTAVVDTGLSVAFPEGYVLLLFSRSGHAAKYDIRLTNCVGVIDADYRGPLKILLTQDGHANPRTIGSYIKPGERVAQAILMKLPDTEWVEATELPESIRGDGGFGSTGTR